MKKKPTIKIDVTEPEEKLIKFFRKNGWANMVIEVDSNGSFAKEGDKSKNAVVYIEKSTGIWVFDINYSGRIRRRKK